MNRIQKLAELFSRFPGIGPRQSKRFVYFLLAQPINFHTELQSLIQGLEKDITRCSSCYRFFTTQGGDTKLCTICSDKNRNSHTLMVVEKDVDLENIERSGVYTGLYFVLGGSLPVLENEPEKKIRSKELLKYVTKGSFSEIVLALSANPDGDNTGTYLLKFLDKIAKKNKIKISQLGRGLSTGSELEYSDTETIKNAFNNRH